MIIPTTTTRAISQLAEFNQWVTWRREPNKDGKLTKVPYNPHKQNKKASSTDPKTWGSYEQARAAMVGGCYDGVGFTLWPDFVPLVGIDIDHCIDEQGNLSELARQVVTLLDSYAEISPSGHGIRIFLFGDLPPGRRKHSKLAVEMYTTGRFLTVTGNHLPGSPETINHRTDQAAQLHRQIFGEQKPRRQPKAPSQVENLDDQALIEMIRKSKQGPKFERLWSGVWSPEYPSQSEADMALVGMFFWWSGGNEEQVKRLFAQSGLYRSKWDREDYQARMFNELRKGGVRSPIICTPQSNGKVFTLKPYRLSAEACARKERILAESKLRKEERAAELAWRLQADSAVPFLADEAPDPEEVRRARSSIGSSKKWAEHCRVHFPDLDAERQRQIKLRENREERPNKCGEKYWESYPSGGGRWRRISCGVCPKCLSMQVARYRRALNEIQGIDSPIGEIDELREALRAEAEALGTDGRRGEPAPPLARIHGPLSILTLYSQKEREKFIRKLRRQGVRYRSLPVMVDGLPAFDFLLNSDEWGDPLGPLATDDRLLRWVKGTPGKKACGDLLPSLKKLEARYRDPGPFELVCVEIDDAGQPVEEDVIYFDTPALGTAAKLPEVAVDFEVTDRESLQAALSHIHKERLAILGKRGVIYGVLSSKKYYTRQKWLPSILKEFNAENDRIKAKQATG